MPDWSGIIKEIQNAEVVTTFDTTRRKYLRELATYTQRNVIAYYSSWLNKQPVQNLDINDSDMNGFMNCVHDMDCAKGLDLILHTPGGSPVAAEAIVNYLRRKFNSDIRVIVPHLAMSAGTMIACAARQIIMGVQSSLGPIDPQFNGIPAYNIMSEFQEAKDDLLKNPANTPYWTIKLQQYPAAFNSSKVHNRHFSVDFCKSIGLNVLMLEDDNILQDKVLSVHHAYVITFDATPAVKIIENQNGKSFISALPQIPMR